MELNLEPIWTRSAAEKVISMEEGFPPPEIRQELKREDVPEADKEWLLNVLRVTAARKERILYTNDGRTIDLPRDIGILRWGIVSSKNFRYFMLWPWRSWASEGKSYMESKARLKPPDPQYLYWGAEKVEQARRGLEEYERLEKESDFILMDSDGNKLWRQHNMPERIYISDDGRTVVATHKGHFFGSACFYDIKGELVRKVKFPYGRGGNADLSANGEVFVVIAGLASEDGHSTVIAYGPKGDKLWETRLLGKPNVGGTARRVFVSTTGKFVAVSFYSVRKTYLFDRKGDLVRTFDIVATWAGFSAEDDYVVLVGRGKVVFAETKQGRVVWSTEGKSTERVSIDPNGEFVLLLGRSGSSEDPGECQLEAINQKGQVSGREIIQGTSGYWPECHISEEGSYILVDTGVVLAILDLSGLK